MLSGPFQKQHGDEILRLARNVEWREKKNHPLRRILSLEEQGDNVLITTTTMGMARAIGDAVRHACKGDLLPVHGRGRHPARDVETLTRGAVETNGVYQCH